MQVRRVGSRSPRTPQEPLPCAPSPSSAPSPHRIKTDMGDATRGPGSGTRSRAPHPRPVDADVTGPRLQHRPASPGAPGRGNLRERRRRPHAQLREGRRGLCGRYRGPCPGQRRPCPGPQRRRAPRPERRHLLGRRSHARHRLPGSRQDPRGHHRHHQDPGREHHSPRPTAQRQSLSVGLSGSDGTGRRGSRPQQKTLPDPVSHCNARLTTSGRATAGTVGVGPPDPHSHGGEPGGRSALSHGALSTKA